MTHGMEPTEVLQIIRFKPDQTSVYEWTWSLQLVYNICIMCADCSRAVWLTTGPCSAIAEDLFHNKYYNYMYIKKEWNFMTLLHDSHVISRLFQPWQRLKVHYAKWLYRRLVYILQKYRPELTVSPALFEAEWVLHKTVLWLWYCGIFRGLLC